MPSIRREDALSEVIGFILILALIAVLASLYLTYVVPAQGREAEIKHMAGINDEFLGYKTAVDSLWINDQANVPISRTFTLGTLTGLTQGAFVVPLFQPYPSSGTIVVNGRGESIKIVADVIVQDISSNAIPSFTPVYYSKPDQIYLMVNTTNNTNLDSLILKPSVGNWTVWINVTWFARPSQGVSYSPGPFPTPTPIPQSTKSSVSWEEFLPWVDRLKNWLQSSGTNIESMPYFTMTIKNFENFTFSDLTIIKNIQNDTDYLIDLMDETYGLRSDLKYPFTLNISRIPSANGIKTINFFYPAPVGYRTSTVSKENLLGSVEFRSGNSYWIQQNYYYQQGGIFLQQSDGMVTKVVPLISITNQSGIPSVRVVDVIIEGSGNIGGTSPVQVISRLNSVSNNIFNGSTLAQGIPNARNVTIIVNTQDNSTAQMWNQTFSRIRQKAVNEGINQTWITNNIINQNQVQIKVVDPSSTDYKLFFDYTMVNLTVELQPVAI